MEDLLEKLSQEKTLLLQDVLEVEHNDRTITQQRIQALKGVFEEIELVAAAATPVEDFSNQEPANPNPVVLTEEFYASYLVVLLLAKNLNDARFLWKRIAAETKLSSELLNSVWAIGKALWKRDVTAAYTAMSKPWRAELAPLVKELCLSTRQSTAELLSVAYSTIAIKDAAMALGFAADKASLLAYCESLGWDISHEDQLVRPKALPRAPSQAGALKQLDMLSQYVLHLEQSTLIKLP